MASTFRYLLPVPLLLLAVSCATSPAPVDRAAEEAAIRSLDEQWSATAAKNDVDGTVGFYADDAVILAPNALDPVAWTGCDVGGVKFWYEDYSAPDTNGTAAINIGAGGIDIVPGADPVNGLIGGVLSMILPGPVWGGVSFSFSVANFDPLDVIQLSLNNPGADVVNVFGTDLVSGAGTIGMSSYPASFPTGPWYIATLSPILVNGMAQGGNDFFVSAIEYDTSSPEPASYALIGSGLLLVGFGQRRLAKRKS